MSKTNISRRGFLASALAGFAAAAAGGTVAAPDGGYRAETRRFATEEAAVAEAWRLIEEEGCCRAIVKGGEIVSVERGRGAGPFIRLLEARPGLLEGAIVVDSTVGTAAAAVAVKGGAVKVLARTASDGAAAVLKRAGVPLEAKVAVRHIMNRLLTGPCPVEASVTGLEDPGEIIAAARRTIESMRG